MQTGENVDAALIAYMKSVSAITTALGKEVRETSWQGTDFTYPALRIYTDIIPSNNNCSPERVDAVIEIFDEQKSSKLCQHISGIIQTTFHRAPFTSLGLKFVSSIVTKVQKPERSIYAWVSRVNIEFLVN